MLEALGREPGLLQKKIDELRTDELRTFERDHRAGLLSHLEGQLLALERSGAGEAADSEGDGKQQAGSGTKADLPPAEGSRSEASTITAGARLARFGQL